MIEFKNVVKRYGDKTAVDNLSFNIDEGEFFVLIGPSGCGKTTTLKMINRLISLTEGYIYFKDKPISDYPVYEMRWDIGYVLQQIALFPHLTIKENIAQVPQMKKWKEADIDKRIDELMDMVGLEPEVYKDRKPDELSGGQQQRVGVVRALAADPPVILMDEPYSALDPISREKLQDDLIELQQKIKKTIIFVTHDIQEAMKLGDRICLLDKGVNQRQHKGIQLLVVINQLKIFIVIWQTMKLLLLTMKRLLHNMCLNEKICSNICRNVRGVVINE